MTWSLATYRRDATTAMAALREDGTLVAPPDLKQWTSTLELLEDWTRAEEVLRSIVIDDAPVVESGVLLAPLRWPRKVDLRRGQLPPSHPRDGWRGARRGLEAVLLPQASTTTVIGPTDPITVVRPETARYDWEAELAVVIGNGRRDIPSRTSTGARRRLLRRQRCHRARLPPATGRAGGRVRYDWFASKSIDGSLPLGPGLTPGVPDRRPTGSAATAVGQRRAAAGRIHRRHDLRRRRARRGRQRGRHARARRRHPTGTPAGVGAGRGLFLRGGDVVRTSIDGLGSLENPVIDTSERTS